jgi:hypothetical protein
MEEKVKKIIKYLELTRDLHKRYDNLGMAGYDQNFWPNEPNKEECGCAEHTLVCMGYGREIVFKSWQGFNDYHNYIFGITGLVKIVAKKLGFPEPTDFGSDGVVERCELAIKKLKEEFGEDEG